MLHAAPREIGDVQQAVDAAQVHERAVIGDVLDDALDDRAFRQRRQELLAHLALALLEHGAARHDHVVALAVELDDLEVERLVLERRGVLHRSDVDQRARQERADAVDHDGEAALHLAGDEPLHDQPLLHRGFEVVPRLEALGLVARQLRLAVAVFQRFNGDGDEVARLHFDFALVVLELVDVDERLGLEARVDDDDVEVDAYNLGGNQFSLPHFLARQRFLEELREIFHRRIGGGGSGGNGSSSSHAGWFPFAVSKTAWFENPFSRPGGLVDRSARCAPAKARVRGPSASVKPLDLRNVCSNIRGPATRPAHGRLLLRSSGWWYRGARRRQRVEAVRLPVLRRARRARGYRAKDCPL